MAKTINSVANMNTLFDSVINYLEMESSGALMVSGEWGCGKTYHIDKVIIPALQKKDYNPVKVSLFGVESINEIPIRIAEKYRTPDADSEEKNSKWFKPSKGKVAAKAAKAIASIKWLENFVDVRTLVNSHSSLLFNLIPTEKTVIFLDDIERAIDSIEVHSLLGAINDLVEQRGYKVIVIANNSYIQQQGADKLVFKEKVIEKTLIYDPDVLAIFKELCSSKDTTFKSFITQPQVMAVIDPCYPEYKNDKELQADLRNIRILKYDISHINKVYDVCEGFLNGEDKTASDAFLMSLWACAAGLSIEYKKNRLSYSDREEFMNYVDFSLANLDLSGVKVDTEEVLDKEDDPKNDEVERQRELAHKRVAHVFEKFVKAHNLPVIVSPQLFDFITAGISIDSEGLKKVWEKYKSEVQRNTVSPAYALLQQIMRAQWEMSNNGMVEALKQLLKYVGEGAFADNMAYVNSATYLQHFSQLIGVEQDDVEKAIKTGIDKMYASQKRLNVLDKIGLDAMEDQIPEISRWVIEYEKVKMDAVTETNLRSDIEEVCRQFNENLTILVNRMTAHYGQTKSPDFVDYPILKHISETDIVRKVNTIQPNEVMALYHLIKSRFVEMVVEKVFVEELPFVKVLEAALERRRPKKREYSDYLIEDSLLPMVKKVMTT